MDTATKIQNYEQITKQIQAVITGETNLVAKMSSVACLLKQTFDYYYWCGFYLVDIEKPKELVIGPYQGTLGCLRIPFGKGVCGAVAETKTTSIVKNVHEIENHIACDVASTSEIVVPLFHSGKLIAVLDVDSTEVGSFDEIDKRYLEELVKLI